MSFQIELSQCAKRTNSAARIALLAGSSIAIAFIAGSAMADDASFTRLGYLDSQATPVGSLGLGISPNGEHVVGFSFVWNETEQATQGRAFIWTSANGLLDLGPIPLALDSSSGHAVSADGDVVAGASGFVFDGTYETRNGGWWYDVNTTPRAELLDEALASNDVTPDGSMIVGTTRLPGPWPVEDSAFYYTDDDGVVELGFLPDGVYSAGEGVSADGSVIVGYGDGENAIAAFRWTSSTGVQYLAGQVDGVPSQAFGITPDGSTVVGMYNDQPFRWNQSSQFELLGLLGADWRAFARDCSADGSRVVGYGFDFDNNWTAYYWDDVNGLRSLQDVLTLELGLDLTGWSLQQVTSISDDGSTLSGFGIAPEGHTEAWVAHIPSDGAGDLELAYQGPCPNGGQSGITWNNAEPNGRVALVYARKTGQTIVPQNAPCAGIELGLGSQRLQVAFVEQSDSEGAGQRQFFTPQAACGGFLQLIDLTSCRVSPVVQVK